MTANKYYKDMKRLLYTTLLSLALVLPSSLNAQYGDCFNSAQACTTPNFPVNASGYGTVDELAGNSFSNPSTNPNAVPGNAGCLLAGELNSTWILITVSSSGTLEFSIGDGVTTAGCIDWAMWPYNATACADIANNALAPVACNWNGACGGFTGMANPVPAPGSQFDFENPLNVNPGDQFILCFSNYSSQNTNFPLDFFGTAQVSCGTPDITICEGDTGVFAAVSAPGSTYTWDPNPNIISTNALGDSAWVNPNVTDTFIVHITDPLGTVISDTVIANVIPTIVPTISTTNDNCLTTPSGQIDISVTGGINPIEYQIVGPISDQNQVGLFNGLPDGFYTINIWPNGYTQCMVTTDTTLILECGIEDTTLCEGDTTILAISGFAGYTFNWQTAPNMITNANQDTAWVFPNTTTTYVVELDDGAGNISTDTAVITVIPTIVPTVDVVDNTCFNTPNGEINITTTGGQAPMTFDLAGPPNMNNTTGIFAPLPDGSYTITITPDNWPQCAITFDTTIQYIEPDPVYLVGDTSVCLGDTIFLELVGADNYDILWSTGDTTASIEYYTLTGGPLSVDINTGCETITFNTTAVIHPIPIIDAGLDTSIYAEEIITLNGSGGVSYLWQPTTGLDCHTCPDPNASPSVTTTYTLTAIDANGCQASDIMSIEVIYLPIYIPSAFSPNGDGTNDVLYVRGAGISVMNLIIYDRWGNVVFQTQDRSIGWDGTIDGKNANSDVYGYQFSATRPNGEVVELKGNITLMR